MNLGALAQIYKNKDLRRRVLVVLAILAIYSLLAHIPIPVGNTQTLQAFLLRLFNSTPILGFANIFSGGALSSFSIILMGLGPYINASIIMQLLAQVIPKLDALQKEGEQGQNKINYYTRLLAVPLAIIQSFAMIAFIRQTSTRIEGFDIVGKQSLLQWAVVILSVTAGSMLLMWLGEIITDRGVGNGISILILAGILAQLPQSFGQVFSIAKGDVGQTIGAVALVAIFLGIVYVIVLLNEGQRNIPISYARRTSASGSYAAVDTHLPLRLVTAGVIPIIFALAFLSVPGFIGQLFSNAKTAWLANFARDISRLFQPSTVTYMVLYFVLVFGFTYFYTAVIFKPADIAENLQKQGGFVPGIRPGKETESYLKRIINRLTLSGAIALGLIAVLPFVLERFISSAQNLAIGGTSLLILVAVVIETIRDIESRALMATYEKY